MYHPEQEQRATAQPHAPIRRRGREPPKPTTALDGPSAGSGGGEAGGWQLHHSSSGLPFYFNCATGESVWARPSLGNPSRASVSDDGDGTNDNNDLKRIASRSSGSSSSGSSSSGSDSSSSGGGSSSSSGTSLASSSSGGERKESDGRGALTSTSSKTLSTSSASYASSGGFSRTSSDERSLSTSSESSDMFSSSEESWTESMEARFRQMVTSEQGRKLLAGEVEALTARQARRTQEKSARDQGPRAQRRDTERRRKRRRVLKSYIQQEQRRSDEEDVEMALLGAKTTDDDGDSSSNSSNNISSSDSDSDGTGSSFSLNLSNGSDGGSDLSLLTSDVVLERLERVEKVLVLARSSVVSTLRASYGFARQASVVVWAALSRGATRARWRFFPGRLRSRSSGSFSPTTI